MKNSGVEWIGKIPEDWEISKTKYLTKLYTGNSIKDEEKKLYEDKADAVPYISSKDINSTFSTTNYENGMYVKHSDNSFVRAPAGSTLMCIEGGSAGKKKTFLNQEVCFVNKLCCFSPIKIDSKFLFYCLNSPNYEEEFRFNISGMIGGVSVGKLNQFILPKPQKLTQQRISSYLDKKCSKIEETIQNQQLVIEKLKAYKQSLITEAVTGKVKIVNGKACGEYESYKDSGVEWIGKIPSEWETPKIQYIATISSGTTPNRSQPKYWNGDVNWIKTGELQNNRLFEVEEKITQTAVEECSLQILPLNSVLIAMYGQGKTRGMTALLKTPSTTNQACAALIVNSKKLSSNFLWHCLIGAYNAIRADAEGSGQPNLNSENIKKFYITLPSSVEEQECICNYLDKKCTAIDTAIQQKQKLIEKLAEYKKSLIYECVTGKKEI